VGSISRSIPKLSKTRFVTGLQCLKALHYSCYHNDWRDPLTEEQKQKFQNGTDIGVEAQQVYPGGELIDEGFNAFDAAYEHTQRVLPEAHDIYEAAFEAEGIRVRADIVHREENQRDVWNLIEVKSSRSVKDVNIRDVGIQLYVMEQSGVKVDRAILMHMSPSFDYSNPDWSNPTENFAQTDITALARDFAEEIPDRLLEMQAAIASRKVEPCVEPGNQCLAPYRCAFYGHCHPGVDSSVES
jgi:hypothetical protein